MSIWNFMFNNVKVMVTQSLESLYRFIRWQPCWMATKTAFFLTTFRNRKRWNKGIVNGMWQFLGIVWAGRVFYLFRLVHLRVWNSWKSINSWNGCDRFRWTLDIYSGIKWFLFHLNWKRWSSVCLFQVFLFLKSLKRNATQVPSSPFCDTTQQKMIKLLWLITS